MKKVITLFVLVSLFITSGIAQSTTLTVEESNREGFTICAGQTVTFPVPQYGGGAPDACRPALTDVRIEEAVTIISRDENGITVRPDFGTYTIVARGSCNYLDPVTSLPRVYNAEVRWTYEVEPSAACQDNCLPEEQLVQILKGSAINACLTVTQISKIVYNGATYYKNTVGNKPTPDIGAPCSVQEFFGKVINCRGEDVCLFALVGPPPNYDEATCNAIQGGLGTETIIFPRQEKENSLSTLPEDFSRIQYIYTICQGDTLTLPNLIRQLECANGQNPSPPIGGLLTTTAPFYQIPRWLQEGEEADVSVSNELNGNSQPTSTIRFYPTTTTQYNAIFAAPGCVSNPYGPDAPWISFLIQVDESDNCHIDTEPIYVIEACVGETISLPRPNYAAFSEISICNDIEVDGDGVVEVVDQNNATFTAIVRGEGLVQITAGGEMVQDKHWEGTANFECPAITYQFQIKLSSNCVAISDNPFFNEYPWLTDLVDVDNCEGTILFEYEQGGFNFISIRQGGSLKLYFQDGTFYCENTPTYECISAYNLGEPINSWECPVSTGCAYSELIKLNPCDPAVIETALYEYNGENYLVTKPDPSLLDAGPAVINCSDGSNFCTISPFFDSPECTDFFQRATKIEVLSSRADCSTCTAITVEGGLGEIVVVDQRMSATALAPLKISSVQYRNKVPGPGGFASDCTFGDCPLPLSIPVEVENGNNEFIVTVTFENRISCTYDVVVLEVEDCICPAVSIPVCGADGNTYDNACKAACAGVEVIGNWPDCNGEINCPQVLVCGVDGNIYSTPCAAEAAGVEASPDLSPCEQANNILETIEISEAVCGTMGGFTITINTKQPIIEGVGGGVPPYRFYSEAGSPFTFDSRLSPFGGLTLSFDASLGNEIVILIEDESNSGDPIRVVRTIPTCDGIDLAIFNDYPWLRDLFDPNNCTSGRVEVYQLGIHKYIRVSGLGEPAKLYNQDGLFYCQESANYNCVEAYNLGNPIDAWTCTDVGGLEGSCSVTITNDRCRIIGVYDEADNLLTTMESGARPYISGNGPTVWVDPMPLDSNEVRKYIFKENTLVLGSQIVTCENSNILVVNNYDDNDTYCTDVLSPGRIFNAGCKNIEVYTTDGSLYSTITPDELVEVYFGVSIYIFKAGNDTLDILSKINGSFVSLDSGGCGGSSDAIFNDYPWLSDLLDPNNCTSGRVEVYQLGSYKYLRVSGLDEPAKLYNQDGLFYCQESANYNCVEAYNLGTPIDVWTCNTIACPQVYAPVCGVNGITISNTCGAQQSGVRVAYYGECQALNPLYPICQQFAGRVIKNECGEYVQVRVDNDPFVDYNYFAFPVTGNVTPPMEGDSVQFSYAPSGLVANDCLGQVSTGSFLCYKVIKTLPPPPPPPPGFCEISTVIRFDPCDPTIKEIAIYSYRGKYYAVTEPRTNTGIQDLEITALDCETGELYCAEGELLAGNPDLLLCGPVLAQATKVFVVVNRERDCPDACADVYDPVCGVDGNTYSNACEADRAGVAVASQGECGIIGSGCSNTGTIFFENCDDGRLFYFLRTSDGRVYDPYFGTGISYEPVDGQQIKFDFVYASFSTPCSIAEKAITITCLEIIEDNRICFQGDFNRATVIPSPCETGPPFLLITNRGVVLEPYFSDSNFTPKVGQYVRFESRDLRIQTFCSLASRPVEVNCIEVTQEAYQPTNSCNQFTGVVQVSTCDDGSPAIYIEVIQVSPIDRFLVYLADGVDFDFVDGQRVQFDYNGGTRFNSPCSNATRAGFITCIEAIEIIEIEPEGEIGETQFQEYPFLRDAINEYGCATVEVYDQGGYDFVYLRFGPTSGRLYLDNGTFYCNTTPTYDCISAYGLGDPTSSYSCIDTGSDFFPDYPWLKDLVDPNDCTVETIEVWRLGTYHYLLVTDANGVATLYNQDGLFYCQNSATYDCVAAYNLTELVDSWSCNTDSSDECTITITNKECRSMGIYDENDNLLELMGPGPYFGQNFVSTWEDTRPLTDGDTRTYIFKAGNLIAGSTTVSCDNPNIDVDSKFFNGCTDALRIAKIKNIGCRTLGIYNSVGTSLYQVAPQDSVFLSTGIRIYVFLADQDTITVASGGLPGANLNTGGECNGTISEAVYQEYPFLRDAINQYGCATVDIYDQGGYDFVYLRLGATNGRLYLDNGTFYCNTTPTYDCISAYGLGNPTSSYTCANFNATDREDRAAASTQLDLVGLTVYPNPTLGELTLVLPQTAKDGYQLYLHDIFGRTVHQTMTAPNATSVNINMTDYENGIYYIELRASGIRGIQKVVKQGLE